MMRNSQAVLAMVFCLAGTLNATYANTVAYWRFEDKNGLAAVDGDFLRSFPNGNGTPSGGDTVDITSDVSGNGNELRTFHSPNVPDSPDGVQRLETSPSYTLGTPAPVIPKTLAPNMFAFDFDGEPGQLQQPDGTPSNGAGGDDIFSRDQEGVGGPLNSHIFNAFTVEVSFKIDTLGRFQTIVNKDDDADAAPGGLSSFSLKMLNDNRLEGYAFDGTSDGSAADFRNVVSDDPLVANVWYNAAVTNDGSVMRLYIDDTTNGVGDYVLQSAINSDIAGGALVETTSAWTVGRGWFNGPADFFDGQIDEVRISDAALDPAGFLFSAIPEPHSLVLAVIGLLACWECGGCRKQ